MLRLSQACLLTLSRASPVCGRGFNLANKFWRSRNRGPARLVLLNRQKWHSQGLCNRQLTRIGC